MDDPFFAEYDNTAKDAVEVSSAHCRFTRRTLMARIILLLLFGLVMAAVLGDPKRPPFGPEEYLKNVGGALAGFGFVGYLIDPKNVFVRFLYWCLDRSRPRESLEWGFDQDLLWHRNSLCGSTFRWELFSTIVESSACFVFYRERVIRFYLPARAFPSLEALEVFKELARVKVPKYVILEECRFTTPAEAVDRNEI